MLGEHCDNAVQGQANPLGNIVTNVQGREMRLIALTHPCVFLFKGL